MTIPSPQRCLDVMEEAQMPPNIRAHSRLVARVAVALAESIVEAGHPLDLDLVEAAALLHDVGKARCLKTGEDHAQVGAQMLLERGFDELAPIVASHTALRGDQLGGELDEALLVNYADKRVRHDQLVSIDERFADLYERYARGPEDEAVLRRFLEEYRELERRIFAAARFSPEELAPRLE